MPSKAVSSSTATEALVLERLRDIELRVPIVGVTPLLPHRWSEKALRMMRESQQSAGRVARRREPKVPEEEAHDACYWLLDDKGGESPAMPATAFKAAIVYACRFFPNLTMTQAKSSFYVVGEGPEQLVRVTGKTSVHESTPRLATGVADLRYRTLIEDWSATLQVRFIAGQITPDSILALVDAAGRGGVGDWRPSSPKSATGMFGQFRVPDEDDIGSPKSGGRR